MAKICWPYRFSTRLLAGNLCAAPLWHIQRGFSNEVANDLLSFRFEIIGLQFSKKEIVQPGQTNQTRAGAEIPEGHLHGLRDAMLLG